ncbi:hypothetical protein GJAV_G00107130 [Gymnothorax javanicus]|nr:hypothetical protein GJAV_G00107130 [Gymnothorax javanicus]
MDMSASAAEDVSTEVEELRKEIQELRLQREFGLQRFAGSDADIRFYTRFPSYEHLMSFWSLIEPCIYKMVRVTRAKSAAKRNEEVVTPARSSTRQVLQPIDEFFLFLSYLSVGLKERDLANRFSIHQSTVSRIIATWTSFLYTALGSVCIWLTPAEVQANLPEEFQDFPDTQVILDCTELRCQTPSSPLLQSEMYSTYKSHCTMKALVGIAPHGAVTFISELYGGSVSDKEIFKQSGIAELLTEDMAVMVDKGFLISDCCKCKVYCPPFLSKQTQMPAYQVKETQAIARLSVHVERVIRRIKENKLFDGTITLSHAYNINELWAVACLLSNHQNKALVKKWVKFREGLKTLGVLEQIQKHPDSFRPLFCYEPRTLTADQVDDLFTIHLSPEGSNKRVAEEVVITFWRDYLQDAEEEEGPSKPQKILAFATRARVVPPIGFSPSPSVEFIHKGDDDFSSTPLFPMANTCVNCIRLPLHVSYQLFKEKFDFALGNTYGFGRA